MKNQSAHWIRLTHLFRRDEYICSACGVSLEKPAGTCPHCRRPMNGSEYDPHWVDEIEILDAIFGA